MKLKLLMNAETVFETSELEGLTLPSFVGESQKNYEEIGDGAYPNYEAIRMLIGEFLEKEGDIKQHDAELASRLHQLLPLSRFDASRVEFWSHLAMDHCGSYVMKRWGGTKDIRKRFFGAWNRNALGRLWWWSELTKQDGGEPYELTMAINDQRFMLWIVDKLAAGNPCLSKALCNAFIENLQWAKDNVGMVDKFTDEVWRHINIRLGAIVVDALKEPDISALVNECFQVAKSIDWSTR